MKQGIWITMKYKDHTFDVKWSSDNQQIEEIRSIDSEINIASVISLEVKREIQKTIITKGTHHAI
jgi:hypothetical protein